MINKFIYFFMRNLLRYTNFFKNFCLPKKSQRGREMLPYSIYVLIETMNYKIKKKKKKAIFDYQNANFLRLTIYLSLLR